MAHGLTLMRVAVDVTTVWNSPTAPRPVDQPAVQDSPDPELWLAALDADGLGSADGADDADERGKPDGRGRLGLHGRVDTQALAGEPAVVVSGDPDADWVQVVLPWQPSTQDPRGYPGWVRRAHLVRDDFSRPGRSPSPLGSPVPSVLSLAREHLGLPYLWGGLSPFGFDCSGLVHHVWRSLGVVVPRDADDQHAAADPVAVGSEREGDLYFFARPGAGVHHVGIVVAPGHMVHASETGGRLTEEPLSPPRWATLYAVGRLPLPSVGQ
ncbi:MAG: C40 family peptidase [Candidatus Phosphoribacter sp.]